MPHLHPATSSPALAQWQRIETLVQTWLKERQQLVYLLCSAQGTGGRHPKLPLHLRLETLCEVLMDYISAGYFEIYRELAHEAHCMKQNNEELFHRILAQLEDSTDEALLFNEDFGSREVIQKHQPHLPQRLAALSQKLEERFALEDQLIVSIHQKQVPGHLHLH